MLYTLLSNLINHDRFEKEDMTTKLNVFYMFNQITIDQYQELIEKVNPEAVSPKEDNSNSEIIEEKDNEVVKEPTETVVPEEVPTEPIEIPEENKKEEIVEVKEEEIIIQ